MILQDDRTEAQKATRTTIVLGTDSFMSGWGEARGGPSYAGWACKESEINACKSWVRSRSEMKRVRIVGGGYHPPSGPGHCHIYIWRGNEYYTRKSTRKDKSE